MLWAWEIVCMYAAKLKISDSILLVSLKNFMTMYSDPKQIYMCNTLTLTHSYTYRDAHNMPIYSTIYASEIWFSSNFIRLHSHTHRCRMRRLRVWWGKIFNKYTWNIFHSVDEWQNEILSHTDCSTLLQSVIIWPKSTIASETEHYSFIRTSCMCSSARKKKRSRRFHLMEKKSHQKQQ